jgi:hypothetical protein
VTPPATPPAGNPGPAADPKALAALCKGPWEPAVPAPPGGLAGALLKLLGPTPPEQMEAVLTPALQKAECIHADYTKVGEPPVLVASIGGGAEGALLWRKGDSWLGQSTPGLQEFPTLLRQELRPGLRDVFVAAYNSGTGHFGALLIFRQNGDTWASVLATETYDHFAPRALDGDDILVTARNPGDAPLAWEANCCVPTDYQWLWQRSGDKFLVVAKRRAPDPYYSLNVFFGALQKQKPDALANLATPEAVAAARRLKLDAPGVQTNPDPTNLFEVADVELKHWSALPPALNGPAPTKTSLTARVEVQGGIVPAVLVNLRRIGAEWVVTGVSTP